MCAVRINLSFTLTKFVSTQSIHEENEIRFKNYIASTQN